ncbi:MAG: glycosyltransferase family 2 protein [Alphaproteobacteria bacterium]|nr:glycosyltransferase family 2 protein [Alphaproteobacteria bacterium]
MDISIVIPVLNEEDSLPELVAWIHQVVTQHHISYEILFIDDGSTDNSWDVIKTLKTKYSQIKGLKFIRNYGKSAALNEGFRIAQGDYVITMDADLQDSPDEIPELLTMAKEGKFDIISGWKKKRYDNKLTKNFPSKIFNATARKFSGLKLHDFNCGLKIYRLKVIKSIEVFGEMHRYIPFIAKRAGFTKIGEKVVTHRPRKYGQTKYGWDRFINGFVDLITILFLMKFGKKPMQFFGTLGAFSFLAGFLSTLWLAIEKFIFDHYGLAQRPFFYVALISMIIGIQLFICGFIAELIVRNANDRNSYILEDSIHG